MILCRFKTNLRKEDAGVFKATVKQLLSEKREAELRDRIELEAANAAAAAKAAAEEKATAEKGRGGLLGYFLWCDLWK